MGKLSPILIVTLCAAFLAACSESGCIDADEFSDYTAAQDQYVNPINPDSIQDVNTVDVNSLSTSMNIATDSSVLKKGISEVTARGNMWFSFQDSSKNDVYVYNGRNVKFIVSGSVLLKGFQKQISMPAVVQSITVGGNTEYYIPLTHSGIVLPAGAQISISVNSNPSSPVYASGLTTTPDTSSYPSCSTTTPQCSPGNYPVSSTTSGTTTCKCFPLYTPVINNTILSGGAGIFALIYKTSAPSIGRYANSDNWQCHIGLSGKNDTSCPGGACLIHDNITGCANDYQFSGCNDGIKGGTGLCAGFQYNASDISSTTSSTTNFLNNSTSYLAKKDDSTRQRYLFWVYQGSTWNIADFIGVDNVSGPFGSDSGNNSATGQSTPLGVNYTGGTSVGGPHTRLTSNSLTCRLRVTNPWANLYNFALCTYDKNFNGWSTSDVPPTGKSDYEFARFSYGPLSGWYFNAPDTNAALSCNAVDQAHNISATASYYGGLLSYGLANTNVFWGSQATSKMITECHQNSCNGNTPSCQGCTLRTNSSYNSGTRTSSSTGTTSIQPTICKPYQNTPITLQWPLQYIAVKSLVADPSNVTGSCTINITSTNGNDSLTINPSSNSDWMMSNVGTLAAGNTVSFSGSGHLNHKACDFNGNDFSQGYKIYNTEYCDRDCTTATAFGIKAIPFVSCVSGYKLQCSNSRVNAAYSTSSLVQQNCINSTNMTLSSGGTASPVAIGSCNKVVTDSNGNQISSTPQRYRQYNNASGSAGTGVANGIQDAPSTYDSSENVAIEHCGLCIASSIVMDPSGTYYTFDPTVTNNLSPITGTGAKLSRTDCSNDSKYQWVTTYIDLISGNRVSYAFTTNSYNTSCQDSSQSSSAGSYPRPLVPLYNGSRVAIGSQYGVYGSISGWNTGSAGGNDLSTLLYTVPDDMDNSTIAFGIAGVGNVLNKMFSASDQTNNTVDNTSPKTYKNVTVTVSTGKAAKNGKYLYFYVQGFAKDTNGNDTDKLDVSQDPKTLFKDSNGNALSHDDILKKAGDTLYDFSYLASQYGDSTGGIATWPSNKSGKLWAIILDATYPSAPGSVFPDKDGKEIVFNKSVATTESNVVSSDNLQNVVSWNSGKYLVKVKAQGKGDGVVSSTFINDLIVSHFKDILFGPISTDNSSCNTVLNVSGANLPPVMPTVQPASYSPTSQQCNSNNLQTKNVIMDNALSDGIESGQQNTQYYKCFSPTSNASILECYLYNRVNGTDSQGGNSPLPLKVLKYGEYQDVCDASTGQPCSAPEGKKRRFSLYELITRIDSTHTSSSILSCISQNYTNRNCWLNTGSTSDIAYPYFHIRSDDFVPGNIMPPCNNDPGLLHKSYTNCRTDGWRRLCNIKRNCYPNQSFISETGIQVQPGVDTVYDPTNIISNIQNKRNCNTLYQKIQYQNCNIDQAGNKKCDITTTNYDSYNSCSSGCVRPTDPSCSSTNDTNTGEIVYHCDANVSCDISQYSSQFIICNDANSTITSSIGEFVSPSISDGTVGKKSLSCEVESQCNYNSAFVPSSANTPLQANKTSTVCDSETNRDWTQGLIYIISTALTKNVQFQIIFYMSFILWITIKGYKFITGGMQLKLKDIMEDFAIIGLVFALISPASWNFYQHFVVQALINLTEGVINIIATSISGDPNADGFGPVYQFLNTIFLSRNSWRKISALIFSEWYGIFYFLAITICMIIYLMTVIMAIISYLSSLIMMTLLMCLGPLCIAFMLHDETRSYTSDWFKKLIKVAIAQFGLFAMIAIFSMLFVQILESILYFKVCFRSIIKIPVVNITLLGWWRMADVLPSFISTYLQTNAANTATLNSVGQFPSFSKILVLLFIVAIMQKFVDKPIVGGDAGLNDFGKGIKDVIGSVRNKLNDVINNAPAAVAGLPAKAIEALSGDRNKEKKKEKETPRSAPDAGSKSSDLKSQSGSDTQNRDAIKRDDVRNSRERDPFDINERLPDDRTSSRESSSRDDREENRSASSSSTSRSDNDSFADNRTRSERLPDDRTSSRESSSRDDREENRSASSSSTSRSDNDSFADNSSATESQRIDDLSGSTSNEDSSNNDGREFASGIGSQQIAPDDAFGGLAKNDNETIPIRRRRFITNDNSSSSDR